MEPYRAFISDRLPKNQFARGFLTQSMFVGAGAVTANLSLFAFQRLLGTETGGGLPTWVFVAFWIGADRKSTRLNSSHANLSYAVFCLKKNNFCLKNKQSFIG